MELTKAQKALFAIPSRWPPIMLGITLSLFISAIFTFNFASRIMPVSITAAGSPPSSPVPYPPLSEQLIVFFFRNSYSHGASAEDSTSSQVSLPSPETSVLVLDTYNMSVSSPSTELEGVRGSNVELNEHTERVKQSESLTSQDTSSRITEPLEVRSISSRTVNVPFLQNSTYPVNKTKQNLAYDASIFSEDRGDANSSKSSSQESQKHGLKGRPPGFVNTSNSTVNQPPSSPQGSLDATTCDISIGHWVQDDSYPLYRPGTCSFVDEAFSCQRNLRPDSKYNQWRWAPRDCIVPRFNGTDLLERLRGKRLVFVGDSLNRNQWESMLCMLRETLLDKRRIVQIHGGRISKLPGAYVFKFLDYECKVEFYTSPYLVEKQEGINQTQFTIRLDRMDKAERRWRKANVLVFNTGHWWTSDKIGEGDNRFREGTVLYPTLDVKVAYKKALSTWAKWVDTHVNVRNTSVFFRGYSPVHYMGGQWNSGGQCQDETEPIFDESFLTPYPSEMQTLEGVLHKMKLPVQVLNITRLSDFRKDAHPAMYGHAPHYVVEHQDCSHWCLPGLPDTWNELLYFALTKQSSSVP